MTDVIVPSTEVTRWGDGRLEAQDMLSVPPGSWRQFELLDAGRLLDPNGYLAPVAVTTTATEDD